MVDLAVFDVTAQIATALVGFAALLSFLSRDAALADAHTAARGQALHGADALCEGLFLERQLAEIAHFANLHPVVAQDGVGGRDVEVQIGDSVLNQELFAG